VVVLAATGWFMQPYGAGATEARGPAVAELTVLTSNLEYGGATRDLIATIRREKPDLIFVQECDFACADLLDSEVPRSAYPHRHSVTASGVKGSALLSSFPLRKTDGVVGALAMPGAEAEIAGRPVRIQLAHPMPPIPGLVDTWHSELGALADYAAAGKGRSTIIAGDFNSGQDHAAFRRILDTGLYDSARLAGESRAPSWPANIPPPFGAQLDHVLVSEDFSVQSARFLELTDTDHRSLLVRLGLHRP
jgi:endonuclease/exonuclease/phosphatase (EEP) superfamily protein YafD